MRYLPIILLLPVIFLLIKFVLRRYIAVGEHRDQQLHAECTSVLPLVLIIARAQPFNVMSVADAFDPASAPLWDTQTAALEFIYSAGQNGVELEALRPIYLSSSRFYPELYELTSFETWLDFLEKGQLICVVQNRVKITRRGIEFLKCRVTTEAAV